MNKSVLQKLLLQIGYGNGKKQLSRDEMRYKNKKLTSRKRKLKKITTSFVLFLCVVAVGFVLAFTVFFKISNIEIDGNRAYPKKTVIKYSGIAIGDNLLRVSEEEISEILRTKLPYIESVSVKRKFPSTLVLSVSETKATAAVSVNGRYVFLDKNGKIVDKDASLLKNDVALIKGYKDISGEEGEVFTSKDETRKNALLKILKSIDSAGINGINGINLKKVSDITLNYESRITIKLGNIVDIEEKLKRGAAALEKENEINKSSKGTLDLRSDTYSYFRAK